MAVIKSQGTSMTFNDGTTAQTVGGFVGYSGFDGTSNDIDITTLASTAKEYTAGLQDNGNLSIEVFTDYSDVGQAAILTALAASATREVVLTYSDASTATFDTVPISFNESGSVDDVIKSTIEFKISGAITRA